MSTRAKHRAMFLALTMITIIVGGRAEAPVASVAEIGKAAPGFTLADLEGKSFSLSDFAGKIVVLEWTNPNCPVVRRTYGSGRDLLERFERRTGGHGAGRCTSRRA